MIPAANPAFYLVTRGECTPANFDSSGPAVIASVRAAAEAGLAMVQIREKSLTAKLLFELAAETTQITRGTATKLLVNDRVDIALAAGADGVQLTDKSLRPNAVREIVDDKFIIGASVHSRDSAKNARDEGADFCLFGPVFATLGKGAGQGIEVLREVCMTLAPFPVFAIGGIDETNSAAALGAGAAGVAAIRWLNDKVSGK